ncbi:MAG: lysophospholipid acyltransferase family protein [Anaerolineales bacterium]
MTMEYIQTLEDPRDRQFFPLEETLPHRVAWPVLAAMFRGIARLEVQGAENLPARGPVLLAANHVTNFDVFALQFGLTRPLFYMAKAELFRLSLLDVTVRWLGGFPVFRGEGDQWALRHARRLLENGQVVVMFPEGTRNKGRGLRRGKTGAARLALAADCPIVPLAVDGTQRLFSRFPLPSPVRMSLGTPIYPAAGDDAEVLTGRVMRAIADMLPEAARGLYT